MTEKPIPFRGPMVRAILAGAKSQTRHVVKPQPRTLAGELLCWKDEALTVEELTARCPFGRPGDKLWVREAWRTEPALDRFAPRKLPAFIVPIQYEAGPHADALAGKLRPSRIMPRWASRIAMEVTGVRVERLQDISRGDAMAEGCPFANMQAGPDPREWYRDTWNEINGPGSWAANPLVWVIEFRRAP